MLFENSQAHSPTENSKGHHKLRLGPCHLPPPQPRKRSPYCWPDKGEGSSWFRPQPSMGQVCRARGRFWGACSRRAPQAGLIYSTMGCTQPPGQGYLSQAIRGVDGDSSATAGTFAPRPSREIRGSKLGGHVIITSSTPDRALSPAPNPESAKGMRALPVGAIRTLRQLQGTQGLGTRKQEGLMWAGRQGGPAHSKGWWQSDSGTLPADLGVRETARSFLREGEGDQGSNYHFIN